VIGCVAPVGRMVPSALRSPRRVVLGIAIAAVATLALMPHFSSLVDHQQRLTEPATVAPPPSPPLTTFPPLDSPVPIELIKKCPHSLRSMLCNVTAWLDANDVPYMLAFGTLLGAIRDGGIIPWTGDVDLAIPELHRYADQLANLSHASECLRASRKDFRPAQARIRARFHTWYYTDLYDITNVYEDRYYIATTVRPVTTWRYPTVAKQDLFPFKRIWMPSLCPMPLSYPSNPEAVLEAMYGRYWRVPDPQRCPLGVDPDEGEGCVPG
jgi:hypothetical protein